MKCQHCENTVIVGRGLCRRHYQQAWKDGTLADYTTKSDENPLKARLLAKYKVNEQTNCWEWTGGRRKDPFTKGKSYGMIWHENRSIRAHRVSYEVHKGPIPDGIDVLHECDNPPCINPDHLFLGTRADNCIDAGLKDRFPLNDKHWNTKLTVAQVHEIRASSEKQAVLANRFGVSGPTISRVRTGKRRAKA